MTDTTPAGRRRTTFIDVIRPGRALVTGSTDEDGSGFSGGIIRAHSIDGPGPRYWVEDEHGNTIGRAPCYRTGVRLLARHYDTDPGHIELTHEWKEDA